MTLSILIPVYNAERYLTECLQSIYSSLLDSLDYEVICWDDGSSDNSCSILEEWSTLYKNFRFYRDANHGVSFARNKLLICAKGDYVWFVDADDLVVEAKGNALLSLLTNDTTYIDVLKFNFDFFIGTYIDTTYVKNIKFDGSVWNKIIRRSFLLENNIFFPEVLSYMEDTYFIMLLYSYSPKILFWNNGSIYRYRGGTGGAMDGATLLKMENSYKKLFSLLSFHDSVYWHDAVVQIIKQNKKWVVKLNRGQLIQQVAQLSNSLKPILTHRNFNIYHRIIFLIYVKLPILIQIYYLLNKFERKFLKK